MQKLGWFGGLGVPFKLPFDRAYTTSYRNCVYILYRFRVIVSYSSKVAEFNLLHLCLASVCQVIPFTFCEDFWYQKTTYHGLSCGFICMILCLAILV